MGGCGLHSFGSRQNPVKGCCEDDIEPSASIGGGHLFDQVSESSLLKEGLCSMKLINSHD
jgi:hypothetical protein